MKKFRRQITNNKENVTLAPELMSNPINSKISIYFLIQTNSESQFEKRPSKQNQ